MDFENIFLKNLSDFIIYGKKRRLILSLDVSKEIEFQEDCNGMASAAQKNLINVCPVSQIFAINAQCSAAVHDIR